MGIGLYKRTNREYGIRNQLSVMVRNRHIHRKRTCTVCLQTNRNTKTVPTYTTPALHLWAHGNLSTKLTNLLLNRLQPIPSCNRAQSHWTRSPSSKHSLSYLWCLSTEHCFLCETVGSLGNARCYSWVAKKWTVPFKVLDFCFLEGKCQLRELTANC